uniref:Integrase zinc-binding domain-containing protein n=1 Tax=Nicotiana tabacum TaxID=4097 RepID=A0A1S3YLW8_TOBAC|nr:PREDICTED: uncharacterized protein LOC107777691 [Nicotiana tabacum]
MAKKTKDDISFQRAVDIARRIEMVTVGDDRVLQIHDRICVPNVDGLRELILEEDHSLRAQSSGCPQDVSELKAALLVEKMKKYIVAYVAQCLNCQQVKYDIRSLRWYRSPVVWFKLGEARLLDIDLVYDSLEKVKMLKDRLLTTHSRQKSFADRRVCDVAFMVG